MRKSRADGNDIRLVYLNGSNWEEIDWILDSGTFWDSKSTKIWFKTQKAINAFSYDSNYYLYYGNTLAGLPPINSTNIFLFYDGFESGKFNLWDNNNTETGDSITVSTDQVQTGNYAAKAQVDNQEGAQAMIWKDLSGHTSLFAKTHIYLDPSFNTSDHVTVLQFVDISAGWQNLISTTINSDMTLYMWNDYIDEAYGYMVTSNISTGSWHLLEIQVTFSETNGEARLWLDGNLEIEQTSVNLSDSSSIRFCEGYYWGNPKNESNTLYFDNTYLRLYINPEPVSTLTSEEILRPSINDFNFYKEITILHTKVSGSSNLINFPMLISIFDSDLHDHAQSDGDDIAFWNRSTWLDHEIELFNQDYNSTHAQLVAWVRIPSLSPSVDTNITIYYGNSTLHSQENPEGVWDMNYNAIWHLNNIPTEIANEVFDSTFYGNDGITNGSMDATNLINCKIGEGFALDGIDDCINISESSSLDSTSDGGTLSLWINWENSSKTGKYQRIMTTSNRFNKQSPVHKDGFEWSVNQNGDNFFYPWGGDSLNYNLKTDPFTNGIWHYLILTFNYSNKNVSMYLDGSFLAFDSINVDTYWTQLAELDDWLWGASINVSQLGHFEGKFDEIRVSNIPRSEDWISTEYNNQNNPMSFYSIGPEETKLARNANFFTYYKVITVNNTKVSGSSDLINFPVLISIFDSDLRNNVQPDGDDIAFYGGGQWLDHEIELFNQNYSLTHAQLIAWVRIPNLSSSVDTNITMYYGNSTMGSQENPNGVWDPNFIGVWHLKESGTGLVDEYVDSSHYGNYGQGGLGNVSYIPNRANGSIGFGQDFANHFIDCGNDTSIDITGNQITLQLWMKYPATHPWMGPFNHKGFYDGYRLIMSVDSQYMRFQLPGNESDLQTSQTISTDIWHHVVATYNGSLMRIYVDGMPDPVNLSKTNNIESARLYPFRIGHADHPEGVSWTYPWLGQIDEVRISNIGRSADWIATEYNNQFNPNSFYSVGNQVTGDITPPDITITSPNPNELFGLSAPNYNLTVIDANLDSIWYSFNGGANSTPVSASGVLNKTMWDALGNGTVTIRFYANDTAGNVSWKEVAVRKDIDPPSITINTPNLNDLFGAIAPDFDVTINDSSGISTQWYTIDGGVTNYTFFGSTGTINQSAWNGQGNGTVTIRFYAEDSAGNIAWEEVTVRKDIILPFADITDPAPDGAQVGGSIISISGMANGTGSNIVSMYINDTRWGDGSQKPQTDPSGSPSGGFVFNNNSYIAPGFYWIEINITDAVGNFNTSVRYFEVIIEDTTAPILIISSISPDPTNGYTEITVTSNENLKFPPLLNIILPNSSVVYRPMTLIAVLTWRANYTIDANGIYTVRINGTDEADNIGYTTDTFEGDITPPSIVINTPNLNDLFGAIAPDFDVTISDSSGISTQWYTIDGGITNYTFVGSTGTINQTAWNGRGNGTVTIRFYAEDSAGNIVWQEITVRKDMDPPSITINTPNLNDLFGAIAPDFDVTISDSSGNSTQWYTIDGGITNYTFFGSIGTINQTAWNGRGSGTVTIHFYAEDSVGNQNYEVVIVRKDMIDPSIESIDSPSSGAWFSSTPPSYSLSITEANLDEIWYTLDGGINNYTGSLSGTIDPTAWSNAVQGGVTIVFYVNDSVGNWDFASVGINRDTIDPSIDSIDSPSSGAWFNSTPPSYSLSITEANLDEIWYTLDGGLNNYTGAVSGMIHSTAWSNADQGAVTITFYIKDSAGNWDSASVGINKDTSAPPSQPSEFPLWIIFVIIGAAVGGVVGIVILKKSKSKKEIIAQIPEKKPVVKTIQEISEELSLFDYDILKTMNHDKLIVREEILLEYIKNLEENKNYTKAAEFIGELILIEEILGNIKEAKLYRQKQIDVAVKGLEYLKDQYEIESKNAAISGDYSKALELYNESKLISDNLKIYVEHQESFTPEEDAILETKEPQMLMREVEIVYSCINDLLTKYFDEIGIKYYSNPQIYDNDQNQIHGLILTDEKSLIEDIDPSIRDKIKSIQIIYTEEISNKNLIELCKNFQNPSVVLIIVGIKWPKNIEAQTIEIPKNKGIKHRENIRINHYELFTKLIGLKGAYETAFNEIIDLYNESQLNILRETHESSEIIIHSTDELLYDLKEKGLVKHKLKEYFQRKV